MRFTAPALLAAATLIPSSMAHFCFNKLIVNGNYTGEYEYVRKNNNSNSPVTDIKSTDLRCNSGGLLTGNVTSTYKLAAGSEVGFGLDTGIGHPGPVQVYMSKVDEGETASTYNGDGDWFKVYELGVAKINSSGLQWATNEIQNFTFKLSDEVPAGQYLLRVEAIALHGASTFEGAQYYISCAQIEVTSSSTATPSPEVKIPGVYTGYESGILIDIYWPIPTNYTMPGPAVWPSTGNSTSNTTTSASAVASVATSASSSSAAAAAVTSSSSAAAAASSVTTQAAIAVGTGSPSIAYPSGTAPASGFFTATRPLYTLSPSGTSTPGGSGSASGTVARYGKCGGLGYSGATACESGFACVVQNSYYSQCVASSSS